MNKAFEKKIKETFLSNRPCIICAAPVLVKDIRGAHKTLCYTHKDDRAALERNNYFTHSTKSRPQREQTIKADPTVRVGPFFKMK